jgi:translocation protein SEC63
MLGVTLASTRKQIKTAYRQLAWRYHPDRLNGSSEHDRRLATDRMISLNEAYRLVSGAAAMAAN